MGKRRIWVHERLVEHGLNLLGRKIGVWILKGKLVFIWRQPFRKSIIAYCGRTAYFGYFVFRGGFVNERQLKILASFGKITLGKRWWFLSSKVFVESTWNGAW
jgi:hypothetical protein